MTSKRIQGVLVAVLALLWSLGIATAAGATSGDILYIQGETASVHQDPSKSAPVLIQLNRGHKVMEIERQGAWVRIRMFHTIKKGWVRSSFLAPRFPGETAAAPASPKPTPEDIRPVEFLLEIGGSPARKFVARCRIITETGDEIRSRMSGTVPKLYKIEAKAVWCSVRDPFGRRARLRVKLTAGDQVFKSFIRRTKKLGRVFWRAIVYSPWDWDFAMAKIKCETHTLNPGNDSVAAPGVFFSIKNIGPKPVVLVTDAGNIMTLDAGKATTFAGDKRWNYYVKLVAPGDTATIKFCK